MTDSLSKHRKENAPDARTTIPGDRQGRPPAEDPPAESHLGRPSADSVTKERRILIVEDDEDFAESMLENLESYGYQVRCASTEEQATEVIKEFDAQVVLLDMQLGSSSGLDLIEKLERVLPEVRCIVVTAYASLDTAIEALRNDVHDYLRKPVDPRELLFTIERCFAVLELRQELRRKEMELAHVSRLSTMGEMVAGIAHEMNQPLYAISNFSAASEQILSESDGDSETFDRLRALNQQISEQAVRAGEIIRRLRDYLGKSDDNRSAFLVSEALRDASQLMTPEAQRANVAVQIEAADDPSLRVFADRIQFEQIVVNLLQNSFDAMADTVPIDRVTTVRTSLNNGDVLITVADRGMGLSASSATELFDPFFTTKSHGMGMGLAICRTIVEAHGGRIWAEPSDGGGAIFTVALPVYQEQ